VGLFRGQVLGLCKKSRERREKKQRQLQVKIISFVIVTVIVIVLFGTDKAIKVNAIEQYTAPNRTQRVENQPLTRALTQND